MPNGLAVKEINLYNLFMLPYRWNIAKVGVKTPINQSIFVHK